jgi:hypothetical protein
VALPQADKTTPATNAKKKLILNFILFSSSQNIMLSASKASTVDKKNLNLVLRSAKNIITGRLIDSTIHGLR